MPRPLSAVLKEMRQGGADDEAGAELAEVIDAVKRTKKAGSITLKIKVDVVDSAGATERVFLVDEITAAPPKEASPSTLFFLEDDNSPTRIDPQQRLFNRSQEGAPTASDGGPRPT